jgi:hypothetical protein
MEERKKRKNKKINKNKNKNKETKIKGNLKIWKVGDIREKAKGESAFK